MTRSGDEYVRGLRDGRAVLLNGERVADVTTHPAFAAGIRTVAQLYDLAHDPVNRDVMTYPSPRNGRPINKCWLVPRTREDLAARRRAIKFWADASYGFLGRSPDHVASFFAGFAGSPTFYARGGQQFADNLVRFAAKAADEDLYISYVIVHPTIDRAKAGAPAGRALPLRWRRRRARRWYYYSWGADARHGLRDVRLCACDGDLAAQARR